MNPRRICYLLCLLVMALAAMAQPQKNAVPAPQQTATDQAEKKVAPPSPNSRLSDDDRKTILRSMASESVFIHTPFPMGKDGLSIDPNGKVSPSEEVVTHLVAQRGAAAKPGDRARITDIIFKKKGIIFEINGGPVKKKKWYERVELSGGGGSARPADRSGDNDLYQVNNRGSYVYLEFNDHVPSATPDQLRQLLSPVFDFKAMSIAEAYQKSLPPKLAEAVKNHRALVGMDREMVTYAKGRPPKRHRETEGDVEYEEWIYGGPPNDVEFVRFVGDKVVRIETMKVDGEKIIRTEDELAEIRKELAVQKQEQKQAEAEEAPPTRRAPTLVRPGETPAQNDPGSRPKDPRPATTGTSDGPP